METELKEKEYYKQAIADMIMKMDRIDILMFLHRFISNIIQKEKVGR